MVDADGADHNEKQICKDRDLTSISLHNSSEFCGE